MVLWIVVGVACFSLSVLVALCVAAVLGHLGRQVSDLLEHEAWASAPQTLRPR